MLLEADHPTNPLRLMAFQGNNTFVAQSANNALPVNEWVNEICSLGRERQKNFLAHASRMIRENFVRNFGLEQLNYMTEREKNFSQRFAPYVHEGNVIPLSNEFERAYSDISRNGNAKIIFTDLCIKVMQNIRPN